jgi:hypothetical protein
MKQMTIEVSDNKTLKLLKNLEELKLIRVLKGRAKAKSTKLSSRMAGSITASQAKNQDAELKKMRNEWERGI